MRRLTFNFSILFILIVTVIILVPQHTLEQSYRAKVWVDKGCGSSYCLGEPIRIHFYLSDPSYVKIISIFESGERVVYEGWVTERYGNAGRYYIDTYVAEPTGYRILLLEMYINGALVAWDYCELKVLPEEYILKPPSLRYVEKTYRWVYEGRMYEVKLTINLLDYRYYREKKERIIKEMEKDGVIDIYDHCYYYPRMVVVDRYIKELAFKLYELSPYKYGTGLINFVASFAQSIRYNLTGEIIIIDGVVHMDNPKFPLETLVEGGDCEDKAILASALLKALRYNIALVLFERPDHIMVGVKTSCLYSGWNVKGYCLLETSSYGWKLGSIPDRLKGATCLVCPVKG